MKLAIINDSHVSVRHGDDVFGRQISNFFTNEFFPELDRRNIDHVIHLGDLFDNRKQISVLALKMFNESFVLPMKLSGRKMTALAGNHDCFHRNTNEVNTLTEILGQHKFVELLTHKPKFDKTLGIGFIPWISDMNREICLSAVAEGWKELDTLFGHFEIAGFQMFRGSMMSHGLSAEIFRRYECVLSGHYHTKSSSHNISYLGTQYELTWSDHNDPKFFHVFDTQTRQVESIPTDQKLFLRLTYGDQIPDVKDKFIRVRIPADADKSANEFIETIKAGSPIECLIQDERILKKNQLTETTSISTSHSNIDALKAYVASQKEIPQNRAEELTRLLESVYQETLHDV